MKIRRILLVVLIMLPAALACWLILSRRSMRLPYHDRFGEKDASRWAVMGGNWQFSADSVVNRSDEHGAKLVTGSKSWTDIALDADVKSIGHAGDVGLMVRVNDAEPGVDAYNGYYVGLRSDDSALVIRRADHGWMEGQPTTIRGGVFSDRWYHMHIVAVGCMIGAEVTDTVTQEKAYGVLQEPNCVSGGMIGLRSMATGGIWRRIAVNNASKPDLEEIQSRAPLIQSLRFVFREDDTRQTSDGRFGYEGAFKFSVADVMRTTTTIEALKMPGVGTQQSTTIRGVVTLLNPLYIQDNTGGIAVEQAGQVVLNLGDEVRVTGNLIGDDEKVSFVAQNIQLTGDRTLIPPASVTSTQAAGVLFDGRLAELRARLLSKKIDADGHVSLLLEDSAQRFLAESPRGLSDDQYDRLVPGSELRVRGVCRVGPWRGKAGGAFTILMRSMEDVEVVSGPPWWSTQLLVQESLFAFFLVGLGIYIYIRIERSKMNAILHERERLAHEMHDTLAQSFAGVGFHLQGVRNSVRSGTLTSADIIAKLTLACDLVTRTHRDASFEIAALHPGNDDESDLLTLLERCTCTMLEGHYLPIKLVRDGVPHALSLSVRDALFHVGREAITNIIRHARASSITLRLKYEFLSLSLEVCDNGCGFDYAKHVNDFGLRGMQARCTAVGATLEVISQGDKGTCVRIQSPYRGRRVKKRRSISAVHDERPV